MPKIYVCSAQAGCSQTFNILADLKCHEASHSMDAYFCTGYPGCNYVTLSKRSWLVHQDQHTGEKPHSCPHDDCDFRDHNPATVWRHRVKKHGHVPIKQSDKTQSSSQSHPLAQPLLSGSFYQYQYQQLRMQPQPIPMRPHPIQFQPQPMQSYPTQYQPQPMQPQPVPMQSHPTQYRPPPPVDSQPLGFLYGSTDTGDDYTMYTGPARAPNGWTEGCMCPELMQRRPSEMPGHDYTRH
ncbi:hypothetical protein BDR07DRAFT_1491551 [Suillus spraguei]|nr:hypothetical protein BDR07DRAFT_1491551 [Suillus spraguei]